MYQKMHSRISMSKKTLMRLVACLLLTVLAISGSAHKASASLYTIVYSYNQDRSRYSNTIYPNIKLYTTGAIDLSNVTITYWFVVDSDYDGFEQFFCDYASITGFGEHKNITNKVKAIFQDVTRPNPDGSPVTKSTHIVNITFDDSVGYINGGYTLELKCRIATPDWSINDQYNDPSFNMTDTTYTVNNNVMVSYLGTPLN